MNAVVTLQPRTSSPALINSLGDVERVATSMAQSGAFGVKDPHTALILCLIAHEEGRSPVAAARDYHVIQGTPSKKADAMLRDFIAGGGRVQWNRLDDECAEATFTHPQGGEVTINWTMARATKAGLGGKDMWKKFPRQMLRSRVVSEGIRTVFPGATSGMYVPEEVADFDNAPTGAPATPQPQRARDLKAHKPEPQQIEAPTNGGRAKAEAWVDDVLSGTIQPKKTALDKLSREHPDLYERILAAQANGTAAGDLPAEAETRDAAAAPASLFSEGPDETQRGEVPSLDEAKGAIARATTREEVDALVKSYAGQLGEEDQTSLSIAAMNLIAERWPS